MKFVSSKKVSDYAFELHKLKEEKEKLNARLKEIKAEEASLEQFLEANRRGESFQFADPSNHLMELNFNQRSRADLDGDKIRRDYARMGKKVPLKTSEWMEVKTKYVME